MAAFHGDPDMLKIIKEIIFQISAVHVIESGTYEGDSTRAFADYVGRVDTIEIRKDFQDKAKQDNRNYSNIYYWLGSSVDMLPSAILYANNKVIFFLDAHWQDDWPLQKELEIINNWRSKGGKCIVIIDDFQHPFRQNFYGSNGGGGTVGDSRYGPRIQVDNTPCDINTFGEYLKDYQELWLPCYDRVSAGYIIASDFNLQLQPLAERYNIVNSEE